MRKALLTITVLLIALGGYFVAHSQIASHASFRGETCFLAADQTVSSTTLASLTGCSRTFYSGHKYAGMVVLLVSDSVAAEGVKLDFNGGSATVTNFRAHADGLDSALTINTQVTAISTAITAATFTGSGRITVYFTFEPSADGTLIPRVAQNSHVTGTLTVFRGSYMTAVECL